MIYLNVTSDSVISNVALSKDSVARTVSGKMVGVSVTMGEL